MSQIDKGKLRRFDKLVGQAVGLKDLELMSEFLPHYSSDISEAWKLLEELKNENEVSVWFQQGKWCCLIGRNLDFTVTANEAPYAIAFAYLLEKTDNDFEVPEEFYDEID